MGDITVTIIAVSIGIILFLIILKGSIGILKENIFLGVMFLFLLTPLFFLWAFIKGVTED